MQVCANHRAVQLRRQLAGDALNEGPDVGITRIPSLAARPFPVHIQIYTAQRRINVG
jgi:hypothetical protein